MSFDQGHSDSQHQRTIYFASRHLLTPFFVSGIASPLATRTVVSGTATPLATRTVVSGTDHRRLHASARLIVACIGSTLLRLHRLNSPSPPSARLTVTCVYSVAPQPVSPSLLPPIDFNMQPCQFQAHLNSVSSAFDFSISKRWLQLVVSSRPQLQLIRFTPASAHSIAA